MLEIFVYSSRYNRTNKKQNSRFQTRKQQAHHNHQLAIVRRCISMSRPNYQQWNCWNNDIGLPVIIFVHELDIPLCASRPGSGGGPMAMPESLKVTKFCPTNIQHRVSGNKQVTKCCPTKKKPRVPGYNSNTCTNTNSTLREVNPVLLFFLSQIALFLQNLTPMTSERPPHLFCHGNEETRKLD